MTTLLIADDHPLFREALRGVALRLLPGAQIREAEDAGSRFIYRVGPPFVRARIGQEVHLPLDHDDLVAIRQGGLAENSVGGLVVVGSHVQQTTRQLEALRAIDKPTEVEIDVPVVLTSGRDGHLDAIVDQVLAELPRGNVVVRTSRTRVASPRPCCSRACHCSRSDWSSHGCSSAA